jgi:hypothetical protein
MLRPLGDDWQFDLNRAGRVRFAGKENILTFYFIIPLFLSYRKRAVDGGVETGAPEIDRLSCRF